MLHSRRQRSNARFLPACCAGVLVLLVALSSAQSRPLSLIRDAEIETIIGAYATPLFAAARLDPAAVEIKIVKSPDINAFVAGGQRIFIFTGLLLAADRPDEIKAVIAHEAGHIAGGHLARLHDRLRHANTQAVVSTLIGVAAAIGSGRVDAGAAAIAGGRQVAQRSLLQYSRTQESAADQAALAYLAATGSSPRGLLTFLEKLSDRETLLVGNGDAYLRTHPLARERVSLLRAQLDAAPTPEAQPDAEELLAFARMKAKLRGFLDEPAKTLRRYPATDSSQPARYARAIAYHRRAEIAKALAEIDGLLAEAPDDPFFHELAGQVLFEAGEAARAIVPLERAVEILPAPLLRFALARAQIATGDARAAIGHLRAVVETDPDAVGGWRELAVAYGRDGQLGLSALASAEFSVRAGRQRDARHHAGRASRLLPEGSPGWLRAQDIETALAGKGR